MERINYYKNDNLYESGLIASLISQCFYSGEYIQEMVLENIATESDFHTLYYCILFKKIKGDTVSIVVIFDAINNHIKLINMLRELGVICMMNNEIITEDSAIINKYSRKQKREFVCLRNQTKERGGLYKIKKLISRYRLRKVDDEYEET